VREPAGGFITRAGSIYLQLPLLLFKLFLALRQKANALIVSFRISFRWPMRIIMTVDKTKLKTNLGWRVAGLMMNLETMSQ